MRSKEKTEADDVIIIGLVVTPYSASNELPDSTGLSVIDETVGGNGTVTEHRLVVSARSLLHFIQLRRRRFHKRLEQRMRPIGPALEFWMEL